VFYQIKFGFIKVILEEQSQRRIIPTVIMACHFLMLALRKVNNEPEEIVGNT
jgi:hypothetical protein